MNKYLVGNAWEKSGSAFRYSKPIREKARAVFLGKNVKGTIKQEQSLVQPFSNQFNFCRFELSEPF